MVDPIEDILYSPTIDVVDGKGRLSLNMSYVNPDDAHRICDRIKRAVQLCEAIEGLKLDDMGPCQ